MKSKKYCLIDLFCGCGGISRGFQRTGHFTVEAGVEIEPHPIRAFAANMTNREGGAPLTYEGDIRNLVGPDAIDSLWNWIRPTGITQPRQLDVLVGGPPCQGFSRNGVRQYVDSEIRFYDDPRNHLYRAFLDAIAELQPKIVLIENVREFLNFNGGKFSEDLQLKLAEIGYVTDYRKICAADFGVPQVRHRVLFVAVRRDFADINKAQLPFPRPTHSKHSAQLDLIGDVTYRTVYDAIADLPEPIFEHGKPLRYPSSTKPLSAFAAAMRSPTGEVRNHVARKLSAMSLARINAVGTGRMKHVDESLQTKKFYGSAYGRLAWNEPSLTITTWVYHVGSGRYAHPEADRSITMREAARLQSFDDDFIFPDLINPVSQMIGNAVPPLLAQAFASSFKDFLDTHSKARSRTKAAVAKATSGGIVETAD